MNIDLTFLDEIGNDSDYEDLPKIEIEDEETEWLKQRLGMVTGSQFGKLIKSDKKGGYKLSESVTANNLIYKIAWERLLKEGNVSNGLGRLSIDSQSIRHGNEFEGEAILKYVERTGRKVDYAQKFIQLDEFIGGTPDGFVGDDGLIEVKCPWNGGNHLQTLLTGEIYNTDYIYQMQGYMWVTGRKWCDFVTYDPDLIEGLQLSITRVPRNEEIIKGIEQVMKDVKAKIKEIIENEKLK